MRKHLDPLEKLLSQLLTQFKLSCDSSSSEQKVFKLFCCILKLNQKSSIDGRASQLPSVQTDGLECYPDNHLH